jgi:hypothetical protein
MLNSVSAHAFFLNKASLICFPLEPKVHKSFSKFMNQLWKLIFSMFSARHIKSDSGFSEAIINYLNKYIFYFKEYIENELGESRLDFSKLKEVPTTELILKSRPF